MSRDLEYLAALDTLDNGKPFASAKEDIAASIDCFRYFAGWADKVQSTTTPDSDQTTPDLMLKNNCIMLFYMIFDSM